jgi:hypothetical protein
VQGQIRAYQGNFAACCKGFYQPGK